MFTLRLCVIIQSHITLQYELSESPQANKICKTPRLSPYQKGILTKSLTKYHDAAAGCDPTEQDPKARVACETYVKTGMVLVGGEIFTSAWVDIEEITRIRPRNWLRQHS